MCNTVNELYDRPDEVEQACGDLKHSLQIPVDADTTIIDLARQWMKSKGHPEIPVKVPTIDF